MAVQFPSLVSILKSPRSGGPINPCLPWHKVNDRAKDCRFAFHQYFICSKMGPKKAQYLFTPDIEAFILLFIPLNGGFHA